MKTIFTLLLTLLITQQSIAQQKIITVSGQLTDNNGEPLPGVNIIIKGTATGTISDIDGNYSIKAPVGSVLVFNFIGYLSEEVVVTEDMADDYVTGAENNTPVNKERRKSIEKYRLPGDGDIATACFSDSSSRFQIYDLKQSNWYNRFNLNNVNCNYKLDPETIWSIRPLKTGKSNNCIYTVKTNKTIKCYLPRISYLFSYSVDIPVYFQKTQSQYSQGVPSEGGYKWFGPETGVAMSWGPDIRLLEYDGSDYAFDPNGRLVNAGEGNGKPAGIYNPTRFFTNGGYLTSKLKIEDNFGMFGYSFNYQNNAATGIITGTKQQSNNAGLKLDYNHYDRFKMSGNLMYHTSTGNLSLSGSNLLRLMKSAYLTPPTFDNGHSSTLPDGSIRSFSPQTYYNPYWLINNIPDEEKNSRLIAGLNGEMRFSSSRLNYNISYDNQQIDNISGIGASNVAFENGLVTNRNETFIMLHNELGYDYYLHYFRNIRLDFFVSLQADYYERSLYRKDMEGFPKMDTDPSANPISLFDSINQRQTLMVQTSSVLRVKEFLNLIISNTINWSSTKRDNKPFLCPGIGLNLNVDKLPFWNFRFFSNLGIYTNYNHVLIEAPINYRFGKYSSLLLQPENSNSFYESNEIFFNSMLHPEQHDKFTAGIRAGFFRNLLQTDFNVFNSSVKNHLLPVISQNSISLINGADINDRGFELTASVLGSIRFLKIEKAQLNLSLAHSYPVVKNVYEPYDKIKVAGFQTVGSYLVKDQPYGVLIGSTYLRDDKGRMVIGPDGYPMTDTESGIIGNPNPDWTLGVEGRLDWGGFSLQCLVDLRKGGDIWNGTLNTMNYFGVSETTAKLRNTYHFLFEGVTQDGLLNTVPVDFANPADGLSQNRWVRYGENGADEEAINDGSYIRLKELKAAYCFNMRRAFNFNLNASIALFGRNLFVLSKNNLLPWNTFSGRPEGNGFDYFNLPGTRSYGFVFEMDF
ncbi:MAG: carboxypeptidase-like regulatory domain-containing protein [Bacteroidales bacterium]|nr:carboxypeptidase-like regulatory domain-containing protein [Bacteroidales bacterium]